MKMMYVVEMEPDEQMAFNAIVSMSKVVEPDDLESTALVIEVKRVMPDVWQLFDNDRMCGECTGAGSHFGVPCKVCRATGYIDVKER